MASARVTNSSEVIAGVRKLISGLIVKAAQLRQPAKCSAIDNGQHETGSGGNGGPIYSDGASVNVTLCGDKITGNSAGSNAFGCGLFFTSNDFGGTLTIADTTMTGNTGGSSTSVSSGNVKNVVRHRCQREEHQHHELYVTRISVIHAQCPWSDSHSMPPSADAS